MGKGSAIGLWLAVAALLTAASGAFAAQPTGAGSLSGIWTNAAYLRESVYDPRLQVLRTETGDLPPLLPWARDLLERRIKDAEAGRPFANTKTQCLPSGVPQMMFGPALPIQIIESPGQVTLLNEETTYFRIIRLDVPHAEDPDPSLLGDSVGHWEGDTLVVDTVALDTRTTFDVVGMPHSDALHVVERIRRTAPDRVDLVATIDDPKTFSRPWTARTHFQPAPPGRRIEQYFCDNNRAGIEGGAVRLQMPVSAAPQAGKLTGSWYNSDFDNTGMFDARRQVRLTSEGKLPPLQPWAARLLENRVKEAEAGRPFATTLAQCLPSGVPAMLFYPAVPIRILETPGQVTMLVEQGVTYRVIRLDRPHRPDPEPGFMGDAVGRWEDDTFVVDTVGFNDRTTIDQAGMPHSEDMHVVERYRPIGADTLELVVRIEDPKVFTAPWTTTTHFKRTPPDRSEYQEYYCENQRNAPGENGASRFEGPSAK